MKVEPPGRGRVWVVDDSALERERSRRALEPRFEVDVFEDGAMMLEALSHRQSPDLLILDWQMPNMSGREVCLFIRERADAAELPIIILTGSSEALVEGLEAGANDYVTKPCRSEELNARATTLVALRRANEKLSDAERQLRAESSFRERFIGILAHDLRQPLSAITLATGLVMKDADPRTQVLASRTQRAAMRMSRMVDELLDFTRSRADGGMPVTLVDGELAVIVAQAVNDYPEKGEITVATEGNTHGSWDADRIAQVCGNLIGNAQEYGVGGRPIAVHVLGFPREVVIEVHNEGPALAASDLSTLFDPFRRASASKATKAHAGLGLGLFIVDQIVRAHRGTTNVRSGEKGTTFVVRLPRP